MKKEKEEGCRSGSRMDTKGGKGQDTETDAGG